SRDGVSAADAGGRGGAALRGVVPRVLRGLSSTMPLRWLWQRRLWFACGMAFVALVVYLSLTPNPVRAPTWDNFKTGHVIAYLWLMLWFGQIWTSVARRLAVAGMLCALGIG